MKSIDDVGELKAFVYLRRDNDAKNRCLLTDDHLVLIRNGKEHFFPISDLKGLDFQERKLLLPLVVGGVLLPLSLVAMFRGSFNPYFVMIAIFLGLYLIYLGWSGTTILTVNLKSGPMHFSLPVITQNLSAFILYVNASLREKDEKQRRETLIYLVLDKVFFDNHRQEAEIPTAQNEQGAPAATYRQLPYIQSDKDVEQILIALDPQRLTARVKYMPDPEWRQVRPHIFGNINTGAIVYADKLD